jgi:MraZ protein
MPKGRLSMQDPAPATSWPAVAATRLTITKHPHGLPHDFSRGPSGKKFRERIAALPMAAQWWKRIFLGNAMDVELDGTGRVLVSPELRAAAGIEKDVMLLGMGNHFELGTRRLTRPRRPRRCARDAGRLPGLLFLKASGGRHMATHHRLVERSSRRPRTKPDGNYVDATFGRGGTRA